MTTSSAAQINPAQVRKHLKNATFGKLFIEELGWDHSAAKHTVAVEGVSYALTAAAEKRGFQALVYAGAPSATGNGIPPYAVRKQIEREISKSVFEHIIIYLSADKAEQVWQWVRREAGKPNANRETRYNIHQSGDGLIARLRTIAFTLEEEDAITLVDVTGRLQQGFDVERVTKRFYDQFKKEHDAFLKFLTGIPDADLQAWYASVMLNRLMFIYFMQSKGFLNGDPHYLRNKLADSKKRGKDLFYRGFLVDLFFKGFAAEDRTPEIQKLLGKVPYLNGGLFTPHHIEQLHGRAITIPDSAFEKLFAFFDGWDWVLDDRPTRKGNEINPDVLGYIFEKYINQKQMGAYYTKEDITEYICRNTIVPHLLDRAREDNLLAFDAGPDVNAILGRAHPHPEHTVWRHLREDPDRYIYPAVKQGVELPLPPEIAAGVANVSQRGDWNKPADAAFALPTEIWRETVARRQRYTEVRDKLARGEVTQSNDLITLNLNLRQFARDLIDQCGDPALLRALWKSLTTVSVLDPTCGSGAFLFAALNVLDDLYDATLDRMEYLAARQPESATFADFRATLAQVNKHPNRRYFILKSIIVNNLYGVDIMEEAVEIAKLRLFLKLVAQLAPGDNIEPLPDIDFNIRAGNTLVGFVSREDVGAALEKDAGGQGKLVFGEEKSALTQIERDAQEIERAFAHFRKLQTQVDGSSRLLAEAKADLQRQLDTLDDQLDRLLARQYGIDPARPKQQGTFEAWRKSHEPFHWFVEYNGVMSRGGFDVIVGNPPYVELRVMKDYQLSGYECSDCGNIYAVVVERGQSLGADISRKGYIVPVSSISTDRYLTLQRLLAANVLHYSSFDDRPSRLFDGLEHIRLAIHIISGQYENLNAYSTRYNKWNAMERDTLFQGLAYTTVQDSLIDTSLPKLTSTLEQKIISALSSQKHHLTHYYSRSSSHKVYYSRKVGYFLQVLDFEPRVRDGRGQRRPPSEFKEVKFVTDRQAKSALCCLNSSLFYWFITVHSDCRHVNKREVDGFPVNLEDFAAKDLGEELRVLASNLMKDLEANSVDRTMTFAHDTLTLQTIVPKLSKPIIDEIDRVLAKHYGFTDEELDYIINYDIKYRMGDALNDDEE